MHHLQKVNIGIFFHNIDMQQPSADTEASCPANEKKRCLTKAFCLLVHWSPETLAHCIVTQHAPGPTDAHKHNLTARVTELRHLTQHSAPTLPDSLPLR